MTDMPTADASTADASVTDVAPRGPTHRTAAAHDTGDGNHDQRPWRRSRAPTPAQQPSTTPRHQEPCAGIRNESNTRSEAQTTTTKQIDTPRGNLSSCRVIRQYETSNEP